MYVQSNPGGYFFYKYSCEIVSLLVGWLDYMSVRDHGGLITEVFYGMKRNGGSRISGWAVFLMVNYLREKTKVVIFSFKFSFL